LYGLDGRQVFAKKDVVNGAVLDVTALANGMYLMHINRNDERSIKRFILER
jgi:hypothetical protein